MNTLSLLLLESERPTAQTFGAALQQRGYAVIQTDTLALALTYIAAQTPAVIILNAASFKTSGVRLCRQLKAAAPGAPLIIIAHRKNPPDDNCRADAVLTLPFTPRKLFNWITRLLPVGETPDFEMGPIRLYLAARKIVCRGREQRVTPKQAKLLELFLRMPGQVLSRKQILKYVWETDYTGDTRTLDVHISWLRGVIERDPRHPRYLRTLRNEGYRLDPPPLLDKEDE
jgi:DNA-binding response OmpR family regulator